MFGQERRLPFFFLVGAGISHPPIPLASQIEQHCNAIAKKYGRAEEPIRKKPIDTYTHWFEKAYPNRIQRQAYLRKLIERKTISHANFRLAHLLLEKTVAGLVVTPNFDDLLSQALTLFGKTHIVCDHPKTVERIDPERDDVQIIHVHGTHWFYDCCNLRGEIEGRAQPSAQTTLTMASKLDYILTGRSPLVIGYAGWEGDVIMSALQRRLQTELPYNAYWFCYRRSEVELLPDWLKSHPDVYFVVPPALEAGRQTVASLSGGESRARGPMKTIPYAEAGQLSGKEGEEPTLSGQKVLDKLIQTTKPKDPGLTMDPLGFFAEQLRTSLPQDETGKTEGDIYSIRSVIERIERAREKETETIEESPLEAVRDALRRSQYREAIREGLGIRIRKSDLANSQLLELASNMLSAGLGLGDDSSDEIHSYDLVVAIGDVLSTERNIDNHHIREQVAKALLYKGITLAALNRSEEEIAVYEEVVKRFGEASEPELREQVAKALVNKGITLSALKRSEEAIAVYTEVVKRFGEASEPELREQVARAKQRLDDSQES